MTEQPAARAEILRTRDYVGWDVVDRAGEKVGSIADFLIDRTGRIRYVQVDHGLPRRSFLLPVHQLEWGEKNFVIGRWTRDQVRGLPPYDPDTALSAPVLEEMDRSYPWFYDREMERSELAQTGEARIVPLSDAKSFKLGSGAPNPRGWNVFGSDGERIGTVHQLLVDPAAMTVRYLDVDMLDDLFLLKDDRHVLVPLEHVDLKERGNDVWLRGLTAREAAHLPAYAGGPVASWLEHAVDSRFGTAPAEDVREPVVRDPDPPVVYDEEDERMP
jgi:sporulation protein YlmC with PRC-barrel domain